MKIYTQDEYYPFQLLSETIEIDPEDTLLMEAVEEVDDIIKELDDLKDTESIGDIKTRTNKVYSKFTRWWHSLDPDKKHQNLIKVFHILDKLLLILSSVLIIIFGGKVAYYNTVTTTDIIVSSISFIVAMVLASRGDNKVAEFDINEDELELFEKYIDSIDKKIDDFTDMKNKCDDKKRKNIDKTITKLKNLRLKIVMELKRHRRYALGRDKTDRGTFYEYGPSVVKTENLKIKDQEDMIIYILGNVDVKDGKVCDTLNDTEYTDTVVINGFHYNADTIKKMRENFKNEPYLFDEYDYDYIYGKGSHKKAMDKLKKEHPYDNVIRETKNKNVKEYIKVHPDEFNEYIYDYFFGKGAHAKAKSRYHESVELMNTAMRLVESGNIDAAQILLNQILSE